MLNSAEKSEHLSICNRPAQGFGVHVGKTLPSWNGLMLNQQLTWVDHSVYSQRANTYPHTGSAQYPPRLQRFYTSKDGICVCFMVCWKYTKTGKFEKKFCTRHSISKTPLRTRYKYHTLILFFKIKIQSYASPSYLTNLLPPSCNTTSPYHLRKTVYPAKSFCWVSSHERLSCRTTCQPAYNTRNLPIPEKSA